MSWYTFHNLSELKRDTDQNWQHVFLPWKVQIKCKGMCVCIRRGAISAFRIPKGPMTCKWLRVTDLAALYPLYPEGSPSHEGSEMTGRETPGGCRA